MKYQIRHTTVYRYAEPLRHSVHELRLTPHSGELQQVESWQIHVPDNLMCAIGGFGNIVHHSTLSNRTEDVITDARGIVETFPANSPGSQWSVDALEQGHYRISPLYFLSPTPLAFASTEMIDFAREHVLVHGDAESAAHPAQAVATRVRYKPNITHIGTAAAGVFGLGTGVCQDQAQVMVACCWALDMPVRYISGYFQAVGGENLTNHAWTDVCPDAESYTQCSINVTHQCFTNACYIRLAAGCDYQSAALVRGVWQGRGAKTLDISTPIELPPAEAVRMN